MGDATPHGVAFSRHRPSVSVVKPRPRSQTNALSTTKRGSDAELKPTHRSVEHT